MVRGVTGVMKGSLEGVERWVGVVEESRQGRTASRGGAAPMDVDHQAQVQSQTQSQQMKAKQEPADEMDIDSAPHSSHSRSHSHVSVPANANITMNFPAPASPQTQSQRLASPVASAYGDAPSPTAGGREAFGRMRIDE